MQHPSEGRTRRRVLIIGGSGGIGAAVSRAIASPEIEMIVHGGTDKDKLDDLCGALRFRGCSAHGVLRHIGTAKDGLAVLLDAGEVDVLIVAFGPYEEMCIAGASLDSIRRMMELNYALPAALIASVLPGMIDRGFGRIVVFGSTFGDRLAGFTESALYAAPKTALSSFTKSVARQVAAYDIRCNMICPGYVVTEYHSPEEAHTYARKTPGGKAQTPEAVAELTRWLVSEENRTVNGAIVAADDGL